MQRHPPLSVVQSDLRVVVVADSSDEDMSGYVATTYRTHNKHGF